MRSGTLAAELVTNTVLPPSPLPSPLSRVRRNVAIFGISIFLFRGKTDWFEVPALPQA